MTDRASLLLVFFGHLGRRLALAWAVGDNLGMGDQARSGDERRTRMSRLLVLPAAVLLAGIAAIELYRYSTDARPLGREGLEAHLRDELRLLDVSLAEPSPGRFTGSGTDEAGASYRFDITEGERSRKVHFFRYYSDGGPWLDSTGGCSYWSSQPAYLALALACLLLACLVPAVPDAIRAVGRWRRRAVTDGPAADYDDAPRRPPTD